MYGTFGYNNITLKCDFMATSAEASPRIMFFTMETAIPCILIFIGNNFILVQVYANNSRILSVMGYVLSSLVCFIYVFCMCMNIFLYLGRQVTVLKYLNETFICFDILFFTLFSIWFYNNI